MILSIAAKRDDFEVWQREKLMLKCSDCTKIDWEAQHEAMSARIKNTHQFVVRFTYHWLPSGKRLKMNSPNEDNRCPLCGEPGEISSHFLWCKHRMMEKTFAEMIKTLQTKMYTN